ncbi:hypothetical protein BAE44_0002464 [Dichanthelium oligosanthes]|uniref:Uncharacterized protein n=1 Tax=Dichanthelium oligosanthes TaxID=888268 RepID=A0A1E5WGI6_9POAL|nr:hypothetical protein BAE44_0002464 [Dichanthelium oligosanthes]
MADAAAAAEAVRAAATEILLIDHDGHTDAALARARALMLANQGSVVAHRLLGELSYAAAVRAAVAEGPPEARRAAATPHLRVARDALAAARRLAPDCVDVAASLGDAFAASQMFAEAESEFRRAESIPRPSDPALHNAAYGMHEGYEHERDPAFAAERVEEARERARASYARMTVEELVPIAIQKVLDAGARLGAAEGRKLAKLVAESFPNLGRAQHLQAYMDLEFVRGLDAAIDKRPFLRRTLAVAARAAEAFPNSPVIASFHAKLLFVLAEQDMVCFNKSSDVFKWLFYAPSSGVEAKPIPEVREKKREKGCMLLESIKEKMRTLPSDKSSTEFSEALPRIKELWYNFLKASMFDYRGTILSIARSYLWRELKKCMSEDPELAAKWISATDIDAVFTKEVEPSHAEEDQETGDDKQPSQADEAPIGSEDHEESEVHVEHDESSAAPANNTESSDLATSVAESGNDPDAKLDKLDIDPKISETKQQSEAQVEGESSEAKVTNTELPDPAINMAESGNDLDAKLETLQIDPSSDSSIATSGAGSSG